MVKFGVFIPNGFYPKFSFAGVKEVALAAEKLGFDSVWVADHFLNPPGIASFGGQGFFDCMITMAALSPICHLTMGTAVYQIPLRHPLNTAQLASTVDHALEGRFIFGVGVGGQWKPEFDAADVPYKGRGARQEEALILIKKLWTEPVVNFEGKYYKMQNISFEPKPFQKPHPPILLGGHAAQTFTRVAKTGDGWHPWCQSIKEYKYGMDEIKRQAKDFGRSPDEYQFNGDFWTCIRSDPKEALEDARPCVAYFTLHHGVEYKLEDLKLNCMIGTPGMIVERINEYIQLGIKHFVHCFQPVDRTLEAMEVFAREVIPRFR